jgi:hypothetical protein
LAVGKALGCWRSHSFLLCGLRFCQFLGDTRTCCWCLSHSPVATTSSNHGSGNGDK